MDLVFPRQLFINGQFVESVSGDTMPTVNPTTEEVGVLYCNLHCLLPQAYKWLAWPVGLEAVLGPSSGLFYDHRLVVRHLY